MGSLSLSGFHSEMLGNFGNRDDLSTTRFTIWLNFAQDAICRLHDFNDMQETLEDTFAVDQPTYSLSSKPREIRSIRVLDGTSSGKLVHIMNRKWDSLLPKPDEYATGRPSHYTLWGQTLELWRVPDADYTFKMRWSKWPTRFVDATPDQVSDYDNLDDAILCLATSWGFKSIGETEKMNYWGNHGWNQLKSAVLIDGMLEDKDIVPTSEIGGLMTDYWKDPFIRGVR